MDLATFCPCKCHPKECKQRALLLLLLLPGSQGTDLLSLIRRWHNSYYSPCSMEYMMMGLNLEKSYLDNLDYVTWITRFCSMLNCFVQPRDWKRFEQSSNKSGQNCVRSKSNTSGRPWDGNKRAGMRWESVTRGTWGTAPTLYDPYVKAASTDLRYRHNIT